MRQSLAENDRVYGKVAFAGLELAQAGFFFFFWCRQRCQLKIWSWHGIQNGRFVPASKLFSNWPPACLYQLDHFFWCVYIYIYIYIYRHHNIYVGYIGFLVIFGLRARQGSE